MREATKRRDSLSGTALLLMLLENIVQEREKQRRKPWRGRQMVLTTLCVCMWVSSPSLSRFGDRIWGADVASGGPELELPSAARYVLLLVLEKEEKKDWRKLKRGARASGYRR